MIFSMLQQGDCRVQKVRDFVACIQRSLFIVVIMVTTSSMSAQTFLGSFLTIDKRLESVASSCNALHNHMSDQNIATLLGYDAACVNFVLKDIQNAIQKPVVFLKALHVLAMQSTQDPLIKKMKKTIEKYCYISFLQFIGARDESYRLHNGFLYHIRMMYKHTCCEHETRFRPFTTTIAYAYIVMRIIEKAHLEPKDCFYAVFYYGEMLKKQLCAINTCLEYQALNYDVIECFVQMFQDFVEKECSKQPGKTFIVVKKSLLGVVVLASVWGAYYMLKKGAYEVTSAASSGITQGALTTLGSPESQRILQQATAELRKAATEVTAAASSGLTQGVLTALGSPENQSILQQTTTGICSAATDQVLDLVVDERVHASIASLGQRAIACSIDTLEREQDRLNAIAKAAGQAASEPILPGVAKGALNSVSDAVKHALMWVHGE
ncbi:MAG: hypothetical protein US69_C0002G0048 [candidate division TM6 bacterium GW2011_GWF2_38_10]|nr:MAG: hypothetical protein US69_C0002G0048 [candidate division TM6 bacterium GW2011_GWF2_38_10]